MPNFTFKGRKRGGEEISGTRAAESTSALALALRSEDIMLVEAKEKKSFSLSDFEIGGNPKPKDLAIFTRQFSVMIDSGLPLVQCLDILGAQQENKKFAAAIQAVTREVEAGNTLAAGMKMNPRIFDDLYTNMVAAGEAGGILDTIFQRLSIYIEKAVKLKAAMKSAMVYPAAIIFIASAVITLILWKVVPAFTELFTSMEVELPLPTRIVIGASSFVGNFGIFIIIGLVILSFAFRAYYRTPKGRYNVDRVVLKLPVFGILVRKISVARFTRTMGTLISSGVPILDALDITARTSGNAIVEEAIFNVKTAIESGRTIVEPLKESGVFPSMVTQMIGVGEETGALETMLNKIADFYEEEVDTAVADLMTAIEPMMMATLGVIVGGIVISMYRSKWLLRLIFVRIGVFSVFVAADRTLRTDDPSVDMLVLLGAVYALSFCWFLLRRLNPSYEKQAYAQIGVDLLLITWMVNRTGGLDSYFSSLYFLEIVMSSILLRGKGAYLTAIAASMLHGVHLDLTHFQVVPSTATSAPPLFELQYIVGITIFGFCAVGFLTNSLAETLHTSDAALEESTGQVAFLQALTSRIIDSLGSGLITTDLDGQIFVFNPAAERIVGRRADDVVGHRIHEVIPAIERGTGVGHFEIRTPHPGGWEMCLDFSVTPLSIDPGTPTGYVWSFDDVTEMREMERKLRTQERMAAIGVMSAGIAHEIRNPLASITGSFALLRSELELEREQEQLAGIIGRETERLNQTINDFLLYARPVVPRMRRGNLDQVIADSVQLMKNNPDLGPDHGIETDLDPVDAVFDESMMRQVFFNLASNAFKAMPDAGVLKVRLKVVGPRVEIRFEDSGIGMTPEQADRVFLPFDSAFPSGTGLGLAIVYQIVNSHQGMIEVASRAGGGTAFTINIPLEQDPNLEPRPAEVLGVEVQSD